jgi:hypothetical protein
MNRLLATPACTIGWAKDNVEGEWRDCAYVDTFVLWKFRKVKSISLFLLDEGHSWCCQKSEDESGGLEGEAFGEDSADKTDSHNCVSVAIDYVVYWIHPLALGM